jgi:hypothetical protein
MYRQRRLAYARHPIDHPDRNLPATSLGFGDCGGDQFQFRVPAFEAGGDARDVAKALPGALVAEREVLGGDALGVPGAARGPAGQQADPIATGL